MGMIAVELAGRSYTVHVGHRLLDETVVLAGNLLRKRRLQVVADANAWATHGERLTRSLTAGGFEIALFEVAPGEAAKSWDGLRALTDWLLEEGVERGDHVLALGGGVIGDLTGFACAILKRGCGFIQLPTTLLAQVDSSVGGKTAINTARGKNLIGAFHQPSLVIADTYCLSTLPARQLRAGYAEILKYGVLGNVDFFNWLKSKGENVLSLDGPSVERAVAISVAEKARIVAEDEHETSGARALLNLGHTFGHAFEAETGYSDQLLHGEAVALGMALAARYSARRDLIAQSDAETIVEAINKAGLPSEISQLNLGCDGNRLVEHMRHDKKMDAGTLPFILLRDIGEAFLARDIMLDDVAEFLDGQLVN